MKKTFVILTMTMLVIVITAMAFTSSKGISQKEQIVSAGNSIPDSVYKIFKNSCVYCHSDGGKLLARTHVNFPKWDEYTQKEKVSKGSDICDMLSRGKMPPKSVRKSKPELIPTAAQIKSICKW